MHQGQVHRLSARPQSWPTPDRNGRPLGPLPGPRLYGRRDAAGQWPGDLRLAGKRLRLPQLLLKNRRCPRAIIGLICRPFPPLSLKSPPPSPGYRVTRRPPPTLPPPFTSTFSRRSRPPFDRSVFGPIARRMTPSSRLAATTSGSTRASNRPNQNSGPRQKSRTCNCPHHRCETLPPSEKTRPSALRRGPETVRTEAALGHRAR